jgi:Tfp pilus tip-associated adhesin PilY1
VLRSDLADVTNAKVYLDGTVTGAGSSTTFTDLAAYIATRAGWYRDLPADGTTPSTRVINAAINLAPFVFYSDYTPGAAACEAEGSSRLSSLYVRTGTAYPFAVLGSNSSDTVTTASGTLASLSLRDVSLGSGLASQPVEHRGTGLDPGQATIITQGSAADLDTTKIQLPPPSAGRRSWREITP